jgi:hypothetical protein
MADDTTPATPQAGSAGSTPAPAATTTTTEPQAGDDTIISLEEAKKLRREAQTLRARLKAFEDADQALKDAQLSEVELTKKQLATLEEERDVMAVELAKAHIRQEVADLAGKFNFVISAKTLANFILNDFDSVEFEDGMPSNIEKLLDKLAKAEPDLVKKEAPTAPQARQAPATPAMNPGRTTIAAPGTRTPGSVPTWEEVFKRPGR